MYYKVIVYMKRIICSFRVDENLWKNFKTTCQEQGLSTCFILETLLRAYTASVAPNVLHVSEKPIMIKQDIRYEVKRPRRLYNHQGITEDNWTEEIIYIKGERYIKHISKIDGAYSLVRYRDNQRVLPKSLRPY